MRCFALQEIARQTVEDTLNGLLEEEADDLAGALAEVFPDGKSALMLVTARLKYVADSEWGSRRYLDVSLLEG